MGTENGTAGRIVAWAARVNHIIQSSIPGESEKR